jgi:uracil-DNA glycosylase family 4
MVTNIKPKGGYFLISIKQSFANCSVCPLLEELSCILETNCEDDISKVDVIFIAENPGKDEVKKGVPLIGKAGKMFRKHFNKYGINKLNYMLTNVVLCQTLNDDGTTGNPVDEVIERCKINCMSIIKACNPKLIVLMGASPMTAFGIAKSGITNLHGKVTEWEGFQTVIMVHPSFVNRNVNVWEPKFENAMETVSNILTGKHTHTEHSTDVKSIGKGIHRYKIPEEFYTDKYRLVDIQFLNKTSQVLYIFRDNHNNKIFHKETDDYVCYQIPKGEAAKKIIPYEKLNQISIKYRDRYNLDPEITYEGDVRITSKHAMDYYHFSKGEAKRENQNIMFFDIEVDTGNERVFPQPLEAKFPINMLTTIFHGIKTCYVVDNKTEPIQKMKGIDYKFFDNEKAFLHTFIKDYKKAEPDFLSGWNCISFDLSYIFNRLPQIGLRQESFTKFNEFYVDGSRYICHIPGTVAIDQDFLYRTFTFTKMENYKLGFIAQHELEGFTKLDLPLPFNEMYWKMLNLTIEYNIRDTELLEKIDKKLAHINLLNELRIICNTSFDSVSSFGQIDSLMVSFLNSKGIASKNSDPHIVKEKYPGAYVHEPIPGAYDWITDFDFASLYPNLMITYNIGINSFVMKLKDPTLGYELAYRHDSLPKKITVIVDPLFKKEEMVVTPEQLLSKMKEQNLVTTINGCFFKPHKEEFSVFGEVVDMLMSSRKTYKGQMFNAIEAKDEEQENFFYTRQLVYKVLANTLYGVIANKAFRFFDVSLASAITLSGQEALKTSIIEGDAFMRHLDTEKPYESPSPITKKEMFGDEMPDRGNEYIVTGDTDSIFCKFGDFKRQVSIEKIQGWCNQIESFLNDDKIINVVKRHNVDMDFNRMKLKNELIISRGLFLAKKRYAIRVVNNEGKEVDKINYMGVEIKRSDYPKKSKEFLSELLELILRDEKFKLVKTLEYVHRKEREFKKLIGEGDKSIARPVTYGKKLKDYKTIPQGVKAMEAWNRIMYDIHKTGNKAYMYWVRGIEFDRIADVEERETIRAKYEQFIAEGNKFEVIAIPDEEARLPSFFVPDLKAALKFSFEDRHQLMLKPLTDIREKAEVLTV